MTGINTSRPVSPAASPVNQQIPAERPARDFRSLPEKLADWWRELGPWGTARPSKFFSLTEVPAISPNFPCPNNQQTLRCAYEDKTPIHASKVDLAKGDFYQVGQSPTADSCGDAIAYALEAGQGIVQIVSDKTNEHQFSRQTIAGILRGQLNKLEECEKNDGVLLKANKHADFILMDVTEDIPRGGYKSKGHRHYKVTLRKRGLPGNPVLVTVPLTQIGLPFKNLVLKADDIRCAGDAVEISHKTLINRLNTANNRSVQRKASFPRDEGPLLLSKHGHGRNATVATFMAVKKLIKTNKVVNEEGIQDLIMKAILAGRAARPYFVHSEEQVKELQIALTHELNEHKTFNPRPPLHPLTQLHLYTMLTSAE